MIERSANSILHFARNGANRPLHQDRQVLRAGDLQLEQATQDAMLARARRHLHGWGVVSGFFPHVQKRTSLRIGPGYGVTPFGDELFLPEPVSLDDIAETALLCCGPGPLGCDVIDAKVRDETRRAAAEVDVTAWLIARPASREASPRPGVPEDCAHPATTLLPSRRCGGVEFAILCTLPPSHLPKAPDCEGLSPFVCGTIGAATQPLPWETPLEPEANFLVIAELAIAGGEFTATVGFRRTLWPVALIQDWIASCLCPALNRETSPKKAVDADDRTTGTRTGATTTVDDTATIRPETMTRTDKGVGGVLTLPERLIEPARRIPTDDGPIPGVIDDSLARLTLPGSSVEDRVAVPREMVVGLRDRLTESVTGMTGIGAARAASLAGIGVTTEGDFLTTPPERLATALKLPETKVAEMKDGLNLRRNLGLTFR